MEQENLKYKKVDQPKAPNLYPDLSGLDESLKDLTEFEKFTNTDRMFQNPTGDRQFTEKGEPYDLVEKPDKAKKVATKEPRFMDRVVATQKEHGSDAMAIHEKDIKNIEPEELDDVIKDFKAFERYIGVANDDLVGFNDAIADTELFNMDSDKPKIAANKKKLKK